MFDQVPMYTPPPLCFIYQTDLTASLGEQKYFSQNAAPGFCHFIHQTDLTPSSGGQKYFSQNAVSGFCHRMHEPRCL